MQAGDTLEPFKDAESVQFEAVNWFRRLPCGHPQKLHVPPGAAAPLVHIFFLYSRWQHTGFCQFVCEQKCSTCIKTITTFYSDVFISKNFYRKPTGKSQHDLRNSVFSCKFNILFLFFFFFKERSPPSDAQPQTGYFFKPNLIPNIAKGIPQQNLPSQRQPFAPKLK